MQIRMEEVRRLTEGLSNEEMTALLISVSRETEPVIRREDVRRESAAAEILLRSMVAVPSAAWTRTVGPQGKPFIPELLPLQFNLAHSGGMTACVVAEGDVGIDLQQIVPPADAVVKRYYLPWEQKLVAEAEDPALIFTALWTAREALGKWDGRGLTWPGRHRTYELISCPGGGYTPVVEGVPVCHLEFYRAGDYMIAVCAGAESFVPCEIQTCCDKIIHWNHIGICLHEQETEESGGIYYERVERDRT